MFILADSLFLRTVVPMTDEYSRRTESTLSWQLKPLLPGRSQTAPIGGMSEDGSRICVSEKKQQQFIHHQLRYYRPKVMISNQPEVFRIVPPVFICYCYG